MKSEIEKLYHISLKEEKKIIGLMSGTSLDGLDIALVSIKGNGTETIAKLEHFETKTYGNEFRQNIQKIFAKKEIDQEWLCCLHPWVAEFHSKLIIETLSEWGISPDDIDLVASHGQTVYHAPKEQHALAQFPNSTLQLGDGDHMAHELNMIVMSDFRQKHIAAGGEGAPLALYGDFLLFHTAEEDRILLNLGGIANLTYLPRGGAFGDSICSDVGPGNTLLDAYAQAYFNMPYDKDARLAKAGKLSQPLLDQLTDHDFYQIMKPKTTGPEVFNLNYVERAVDRLSAEDKEQLSKNDVMHTLAHFTVWGIERYLTQNNVNTDSVSVYLSGGGIHNPLINELLAKRLGNDGMRSTQDLGVDPDAKEAILFALLANETLSGNLRGMDHPYYPAVHMGKISLPN